MFNPTPKGLRLSPLPGAGRNSLTPHHSRGFSDAEWAADVEQGSNGREFLVYGDSLWMSRALHASITSGCSEWLWEGFLSMLWLGGGWDVPHSGGLAPPKSHTDSPPDIQSSEQQETRPWWPFPHLECLCHWHCSCFSYFCHLDTKFFGSGTLSVQDLLISQHQTNSNDLQENDFWSNSVFLHIWFPCTLQERFFPFDGIGCRIFIVAVVKWWIVSRPSQGIVSMFLLQTLIYWDV